MAMRSVFGFLHISISRLFIEGRGVCREQICCTCLMQRHWLRLDVATSCELQG